MTLTVERTQFNNTPTKDTRKYHKIDPRMLFYKKAPMYYDRCKLFARIAIVSSISVIFVVVPGCCRFITNIGLAVGIPTPADLSGISTDKINETQLIKLMFKKEYVFI